MLGIILTENYRFFSISDVIADDDFFHPTHADIFKACKENILENRPVSPVILKDKFDNDYLVGLISSYVSPLNITEYARIIADLSARRRILQTATELIERIKDDDVPAHELVSDVVQRFSAETPVSDIVKTKKQIAIQFLESLDKPKECFSTGIPALDKVMGGGLYAGFTYGLAGAEKRGKTTLAHTISHNLNQNRVLHAYVALEMGVIQIEARNQARMAGVNSLAFLQDDIRNNVDLKRRIAQNINDCPDSTLYLNMPGSNFGSIQTELSRLITKHKIKGFVIDYWQLIGGGNKGQMRSEFLFDVAQWLANFARKHGVFCILLSQVNREGSMFGSSGIEKACDQLYTIELSESGEDLWLKMTHSRYTPLCDVGSINNPFLTVNKKSGPYVMEI